MGVVAASATAARFGAQAADNGVKERAIKPKGCVRSTPSSCVRLIFVAVSHASFVHLFVVECLLTSGLTFPSKHFEIDFM